MQDSPPAEPSSARINHVLLLILAAALTVVFLYDLRTIIRAPIAFIALVVLLLPFREHRAVMAVLRVLTGLFLVAVLVWLKALIPAAIITILFTILLRAPVEHLTHRGIKRPFAVMLLVIASFAILGVIALLVVPALGEQTKLLLQLLPEYYQRLKQLVSGEWLPQLQQLPLLSQIDWTPWKEKIPQIGQKLLERFANAGGDIVVTAAHAVSQLLNLLLVPVAVIYLLSDERPLTERILTRLPDRARRWEPVMNRCTEILAKWLRGQMLVALFIGTMTGIGLWIIGVNYALLIGLLTMLLAFVPYVGVLTSLAISLLIGLTGGGGGTIVWKILVVYGIVQLLEGNVITPKIMGKAVGLSDLSTLVALAAGAQLFGIFGMIFAVPVTAIIRLTLREVIAGLSELPGDGKHV